MAQNTSSAVMQQRAEPHDSLDDFPTPPWAGRALMEHVIGDAAPATLWEPAVNRGFLLRGLVEYFTWRWASDIFDYGVGAKRCDYLFEPAPEGVDWIITNPPFRLAHAFIEKAMGEARIGCAVLVRTSFLEGVNRYDSLWSRTPPTFVAQFAERVPMVKGRCDPEASTATSYCWVGWIRNAERRPMLWIPPCRTKLERPGDYDALQAVPA
ncbi:MAG: methyltransferase [Armatimonadia bacterium]